MKAVETPLMKQYYTIKAKHPDAILLFRVGDFYETFEDDAVKASGILGITLTKRANGTASFVELAGFPHHALDTYLPKLVRAGCRVAIYEQLEDPKMTKTIVKRGITELVTPGISMNDNVLEQKENNFLASIYIDKQIYGISFLDISTGEFLVSQGNKDYVEKLLQNFKPKELIYEKSKKKLFFETFRDNYISFGLEDWIFTEDNALDKLKSQFKTSTLKGFGVDKYNAGVIAAGAILDYLDFTQHINRDHINNLSRIDENQYVWLDKFTIRNLEIFNSNNEGGKSLIDIVDSTITSMGGRLLKRWIGLPLKSIELINERLDIVDYLIRNSDFRETIHNQLVRISDIERLSSKVAVLRINPRELVSLKNSLDAIIPVIEACKNSDSSLLKIMSEKVHPCDDIR